MLVGLFLFTVTLYYSHPFLSHNVMSYLNVGVSYQLLRIIVFFGKSRSQYFGSSRQFVRKKLLYHVHKKICPTVVTNFISATYTLIDIM